MTKLNRKPSDWRRAAVVVAAGVLAAAGVVATATPAFAQTRKDDGHALDANTRAGSGGRNDAAPMRGVPAVSGNQIITGNVTGGRQFRGPVPYSDPGSFRGITAGSLSTDRFVRESAGVPTRYGSEVDLTQPQAYYGSRRVVPPPVGYLPTAGATGGYVGNDAPDASNAMTNNGLSRSYNSTLDPTFRSSELIMPTQDRDNGDSVLSASPLYGVRVWRSGETPNDFLAGTRQGQGPSAQGQGQNSFQNGGQNPQRQGADVRGDRFRNDPNSIQRMRDELNRSVQGQGAFDQAGGQGNNGQGQGAGQTPGVQGFNRALNSGVDQSTAAPTDQTPGGAGVGVGALNPTVGSGTALQSSVATGQSIQRRLVVSPEKQTPQLAKLRRAYEQQHPGESTDVQAARQFTREYQAQYKGAGQQGNAGPGAGPGAVAPGGAGGAGAGGLPPAPRGTKAPPANGDQPPAAVPGATTPDAGAPQGQPQGQPPAAAPAQVPAQPERIGSIAEGVQAQGLRDVLTSAEGLMKEQKFAEALQQYDVARQVAPNNALITMGRANAELAAAYYRRAETSLRDAVGRAPELVVAQFDLRGLVGEERLQTVVKDLKDLANNDPKQPRPMLLLAYIAYNTGSEAQAAEFLAAAEQRAGGDDALLKAWRANWKLPAAGATEPAQPGAEPAPQPDGNK